LLIRDQDRFRRHKGACIFYRENWIAGPEERNANGEIVLYEIYCLRGFPPETLEEQQTCMLSPIRCWRDNTPHKEILERENKRTAASQASQAQVNPDQAAAPHSRSQRVRAEAPGTASQ
jgi:hypothetical protein